MRKKIIVELNGGLGNQMFQYAFGRRISIVNNVPLILYGGMLSLLKRRAGENARDFNLDIFRLSDSITIKNQDSLIDFIRYKAGRFPAISSILGKIKYFPNPIIKEQHFHVDPLLISTPPTHGVLRGYWQSEQYFEDVADIIRNDFEFVRPTLAVSSSLRASIEQENSVCLHIRRGDYVNNENNSQLHQVTTQSYFSSAMEKMGGYIGSPHFFVFSDDLHWCKQHIHTTHPITFVDDIHNGHKNENAFQLMTLCKHFIISNSSFSWWATWLSKSPTKKVIAPDRWFNGNNPRFNYKDILPQSWEKIPVHSSYTTP